MLHVRPPAVAGTFYPDNAAIPSRPEPMPYGNCAPVIFAEYAIDTAQACREAGLKNVAHGR